MDAANEQSVEMSHQLEDQILRGKCWIAHILFLSSGHGSLGVDRYVDHSFPVHPPRLVLLGVL